MSKMSWETFRRRKKINVKEWIIKKGITSYNEFCDELIKLGVKVPSESLEKELFPRKPRKRKEEAKEKTSKESKTKRKRATTTHRRETPPIDTGEE